MEPDFGSANLLSAAVNLSHWLCILTFLCGRSENPISQIDLRAHENVESWPWLYMAREKRGVLVNYY
jgi:hypothetical protein